MLSVVIIRLCNRFSLVYVLTVIHVDVENNQARRHMLRAILEGRNKKLEKYKSFAFFFLLCACFFTTSCTISVFHQYLQVFSIN